MEEEEGEEEEERGGLGRPEAGAHSARVSLKMVGCGPSFLALLSFLLPLINISQASLMTRIGLRLGGKHNSVSHQVLNCWRGKRKSSEQAFSPGGDTPQQSALGCSHPEGGGAGGMGEKGKRRVYFDAITTLTLSLSNI